MTYSPLPCCVTNGAFVLAPAAITFATTYVMAAIRVIKANFPNSFISNKIEELGDENIGKGVTIAVTSVGVGAIGWSVWNGAAYVQKTCEHATITKKVIVGAIATGSIIISGYLIADNLGFKSYNLWEIGKQYFGIKSIEPYHPFYLGTAGENPTLARLETIPSAPKMVGTNADNYMVADSQGSKIFAKFGLNLVVGGKGPDEFYYSLCSTKIVDHKIGVIVNFDIAEDKLKIFCTKTTIHPEDIAIIHRNETFNDHTVPVTIVEIKGADDVSAIALLGDVPLSVDDIILNDRWIA